MDEGGTVSKLCRRELRKQKLMEYLASKGKLKPPNPKPYLRDAAEVKKPPATVVAAKGKENQGVNVAKMKKEGVKVQPLNAKAAPQAAGALRSISGRNGAAAAARTSSSAASVAARINALRASTQSAVPTQPARPNSAPTGTHATAPVRPPTLTTATVRTRAHVPSRPGTQTAAPVKVPAARRGDGGKAPPNAERTAVPRPAATARRPTARTHPGDAGARASVGRAAGTKTGPTPALVQPRDERPWATGAAARTAPATAAAAPNRGRRSAAPTAAVSQKASVVQRKTLPAGSVGPQGVQRRPAPAGAGGDGAPRRTGSKPRAEKKPPVRPVWQRAPATVPTATQGAAGPRARESGRGALTDKTTRARTHAVQTASKTAEVRAAAAAAAAVTATTRDSRASTGTVSQWQAKALRRAMTAAVVERVRKDAGLLAEGDDDAAASSRPCRLDAVTGAAAAAGLRTPGGRAGVAPQTEGKTRMTAAQEERMRKLQEWRDARGISYKRPPMPVKACVRRTVTLPQPYWAGFQQEEEARSLVCAMDRSLDDCIKLLEEGCPLASVQDILSRLPTVTQKFAKYWICRARLMERQGQLEVLPLFQEAVRVVLEPVDELRTVVFDILRKKDDTRGQLPMRPEPERQEEEAEEEGAGSTAGGLELGSPEPAEEDPPATPRAVTTLIRGERRGSSVVKYKITATPGGFRSQRREPARINGQELRFFTPVRRSVRIEGSAQRYPAALRDHDVCVASYSELKAREEEEEEKEGGEEGEGRGAMYVYRENEALGDQVHVQLVYDED